MLRPSGKDGWIRKNVRLLPRKVTLLCSEHYTVYTVHSSQNTVYSVQCSVYQTSSGVSEEQMTSFHVGLESPGLCRTWSSLRLSLPPPQSVLWKILQQHDFDH